MVIKITPTRTHRRFLRIPAAYEYLGGAVKEATLRQWIWRRQIESVHIGREVCIPQDALDKLIDKARSGPESAVMSALPVISPAISDTSRAVQAPNPLVMRVSWPSST